MEKQPTMRGATINQLLWEEGVYAHSNITFTIFGELSLWLAPSKVLYIAFFTDSPLFCL